MFVVNAKALKPDHRVSRSKLLKAYNTLIKPLTLLIRYFVADHATMGVTHIVLDRAREFSSLEAILNVLFTLLCCGLVSK